MPVEMPRGLPFSVDTWSVSSKRKRHHFLTHAHKDHCASIVNHSSYPIYVNRLTKFILQIYYPQLDESLFVEIEVGQSITIDDPDGVFTVAAFDANHCPGAVMFLFEGKFGNILHTGDCRLTLDCLQKLPDKYIGDGRREPKCRLDYVFLDCTFGKSSLRIPTKQSAVQEVISCIWKHPDAHVVYLTCDQLGQEEILVKIFQTFGSKIYVDKMSNPECYQVLEVLAPEILSQDPSSRFQMLDGFPKLYERAQHKILESEANMEPEPLIIRPSVQWYACEETDLTKEEKRRIEKSNEAVKDQFGVWHVCFSMHSSKSELEWALQLLAPKWVVSTTLSCRAMELQYVKKHCLSHPVPSDSPLWKLLDIEVESSSKVATVEEGGRCLPSTEELNRSVGKYKSKLLVESSKKRVLLDLSPLTSNPPVTLFGRARLGFDSRIYFYEKKIAAVENNDSQQLVMSEAEEQMPPSCNHEFDFENQMSSERAIKSGVLATPAAEVNSLNVSDNKLEESCKEMQSDESVVGDLELCKTTPHYSIGLSKGYGINLRKLYRSMNVPVPEPLPSLVELGTSLHAKRIR